MIICTHDICVRQATHPQIAKDGSKWGDLCEEHSKELETIMSGGDVKKILSFWVKAQGGAVKATERMQPSINAAVKLFSALNNMKPFPKYPPFKKK